MCDQPEDAQQAYSKARENGLADRFARAGMSANPIESSKIIPNSNSIQNSDITSNDLYGMYETNLLHTEKNKNSMNNKLSNKIGTASETSANELIPASNLSNNTIERDLEKTTSNTHETSSNHESSNLYVSQTTTTNASPLNLL